MWAIIEIIGVGYLAIRTIEIVFGGLRSLVRGVGHWFMQVMRLTARVSVWLHRSKRMTTAQWTSLYRPVPVKLLPWHPGVDLGMGRD
jgi:hypothetical protein